MQRRTRRLIFEVPIEKIKCSSVCFYVNPELREDIKKNGLKNPLIVVLNKDGSYQLLDGHHRLRICAELGYKTVPCVFDSLNWVYAENDFPAHNHP